MKPKVHDQDSTHSKAPDNDTSTYAQTQGTQQRDNPPNRRNERMPHERDESARATGDRLSEDPVPSERQITDAHNDVEAGRVDTERRGVPSNVPTSKPNKGE